MIRFMAGPLMAHHGVRWCTLLSSLLLWACGGSGAEDEPPPAHVDNPVSEVDLTTIRLTAEAVRRIGIVVGTVEQRELRQRRTLGGELMAPPGSGIIVTAPRAATILDPENGRTNTVFSVRGWR